MLTATYAMLTLSVEQKKERSFISRILHYLRAHAGKPEAVNPVQLASHLDELTRFAEARHQHKIENCLIPAVRKATREADPLLADLESLRRAGSNMLRSVRQCLRQTFQRGGEQIEQLCKMMDLYCQNLLARLAKEEHELMPLAQRVISHDDWFAIGKTFLAHDASHNERGRATTAAPAPYTLARRPASRLLARTHPR